MADSNETIFVGTMLRIKELHGLRINPNGLCFFEPNSMLLEIGPILALVPFELHITTVFHSIYNNQLQRDKLAGQAALAQNNRLNDGMIIEVNEAWQAMFGYSREESIGHSTISLHLRTTGEERDWLFQELRENGSFCRRELMLIRRSGERFPALGSAEMMNVAGEELVLSTWIDISERKRAEEALQASEFRFRSLFDSSPDAVFLTIPDGGIEAANPAACSMFGCAEHELRTLGRSGILDMNDPRMSAAMQERCQTGFIQGKELTAKRKTGEKFPVEVATPEIA
jgi:PAS domain S-box-containing protein